VVHDTIDFVERLLGVELNSATDNPMIFTEQDAVALQMRQARSAGQQHQPLEAAQTQRDNEPRDGSLQPFKRPSDTFYSVCEDAL
jgi:hypothetical protein